MQIRFLSLLIAICTSIATLAQGLKITPGTTFKTSAGTSIIVNNGDIINNGNSDLSGADVYLAGSSQNKIGGTSETIISNLYINKTSSKALLKSDINVTNNVVFQNGLLDLNGHNLTLSSSGLLVGENETNHVTGLSGGYVSITVDLNAPSQANPGNLGAIITSSQDLGSVLIQRGHTSQTKLGTGKSILRYFNIQPSSNASLNATLRFTYLDSELNGIGENKLNMWKSTNGGSKWNVLSSSDKSNILNYVEVSGLNAFGLFTLSSPTFSLTGNNQLIAANNAEINTLFFTSLTPNPVSSSGHFFITSYKVFRTSLSIFSNDGKKLFEQPINLQQGKNEVTVDMHLFLPGAYFAVMVLSDGTTKTLSFLKQ